MVLPHNFKTYVHPLIVSADFAEPFPVNGKESAGNRWRLERLPGMPHPPRPVRGREPLPEEVQLPVEPASQVRGHRLEGVVVQVDVVDDRGGEEAPVGGDSQQEGFQPTWLNLEVENNFSLSNYDHL